MRALQITLVKSLIGSPEKIRKVAVGLGLKKMHRTVVLKDTPEIRGMIFKVKHLVEVTEVEQAS